ncbi:hypothetical protein BDF19DRAFT_238304 [Syncephalis fuscata]|nr:hypothetical protein BDF19DRAFT_238304 [Syncephalis fuscata]
MFSIPIATAAAVAGPTVAAVGAIAYAYNHPHGEEVDEHNVRRRGSWLRSTPEELVQRRSLESGQNIASDRVDLHGRPTNATMMSRAKNDLEQTGEDIGDAMRTTGDRIASTGHQAADTARDMAQTARTTAENLWDKTRQGEATVRDTGRSWFNWATGGASRGEGSDEAREQRVANTASDIAASSQGSRREFSDAAKRAGNAIGDMTDAAADTVQRTASETMDAASSKMSNMKDSMDDSYDEARQRGRSFIKQAMDEASGAIDAAEERASAAGRAMADRAHQAADDVDSALRRTPEELANARAGDIVESRELAWEAGGPEGGGIRRTSHRVGMDPYNEPKWLRGTGMNYGHNSQTKWLD